MAQYATSQELPLELVEQIVSQLPNKDLLNFRRTCARNEQYSYSTYVSRFCTNIEVCAGPQDIANLIEQIEMGGWAKYVKRLRLKGMRTKASQFRNGLFGAVMDDLDEQGIALLAKLFSLLPFVNELVIINGNKTLYEATASCRVTSPLPKLSKFVCYSCGISQPKPEISQTAIIQLLTAHQKTLREVDFGFLKLGENGDWSNVFATIRDTLQLENMIASNLENAHIRPGAADALELDAFQCYSFRSTERYNKAFRVPESKKICTISIFGTSAVMEGKVGVKTGLNKLLQKIDSQCFDPALPH